MIIEQLKYITIAYIPLVESVKLMVQEHYDSPEFDNTIFYISVLPTYTEFDENFNNSFHRKIYYQLEHKVSDKNGYSNIYNEQDNYYVGLVKINNITEMWTMDYKPQFAVRCEKEFSIPNKYVPMRYTSLIHQLECIYTTPKSVDLCFIGTLYDDHRQKIFQNLINERFCRIKMMINKYDENMSYLISEMNTSKYILDTLRNDSMFTQNQVRIFELLCMGYTVCSEKCRLNMFPGLIYEWETVDDLMEIINRGEYLHPTEPYKELTYTDEAYEKYVNYLIEQWNTVD